MHGVPAYDVTVRASRTHGESSRSRAVTASLKRIGRRREPSAPGRIGGAATDGSIEEVTRAHADPSLDVATYHCSCGMIFEADVRTGVDCPHCGHGQAW